MLCPFFFPFVLPSSIFCFRAILFLVGRRGRFPPFSLYQMQPASRGLRHFSFQSDAKVPPSPPSLVMRLAFLLPSSAFSPSLYRKSSWAAFLSLFSPSGPLLWTKLISIVAGKLRHHLYLIRIVVVVRDILSFFPYRREKTSLLLFSYRE